MTKIIQNKYFIFLVPLTKDAWNWTDIVGSATRRSKIQSQIHYSGDGFYQDLRQVLKYGLSTAC